MVSDGEHGEVWRKTRAGVPAEYFTAEAAGLRWLAVADGAPVPCVREVTTESICVDRVPDNSPTVAAAARFGADLARTHRAGAKTFGAPPPHAPGSGWIADLPMAYGDYGSFGPMYAQLRVAPYLSLAVARGHLDAADCAVFDELNDRLSRDDPTVCGPPARPARLHGDLWTGNLLWAPDGSGELRGWLIDPAAHGGHPETDLAMLALFDAPHLDQILAGYQSVTPLAPGWRARVALHQVYPLLVHAVLFGGGYGDSAVQAARRALRASSPR
ncbi:MAG: fructosamine kinase family protein [Candidatus Nanopelagicales bacterium]|nr:fructosamine kinase family protein [Candidatus Nanopelagicales bacterium]